MALNISLNGSNYVSDKTRGAFEQALQETRIENQQISKSANQPTAHNPQPITYDPQLLTPNSQLATLDRALAQSYEHQTLAMHIHEQYLHNQSDYTRIFSELMQQQGTIFANGVVNGSAAPQQTQLAATVLETLARSMARFHDLQEQTLDVHKQFLAQQSDYARATIQLLAGQQISKSANQQISEPVSEQVSESASERKSETVDRQISRSADQRPGETPKRGNGNGPHPQEAGSKRQEAGIEKLIPVQGDQESRIQNPESTNQQAAKDTPVTPSLLDPVTLSPSLLLTSSLLAIVSEKTGYPADMLELDMDMESDLGIDSIKRVEILGALQDAHPDLPEVATDVLAEMRTLRQIVGKMQEAGDSIQHPVSSIQYQATNIEQSKKA